MMSLVQCYPLYSLVKGSSSGIVYFICIFISKDLYLVKSLITSLPDGTPVMSTEQQKEQICQLDGEIRNKTVLKAGMLSGQLTHHKGVKDITSCIKRCCSNSKCHVAMMMAGKCYSVFCTNAQWCEPKDAPVETHHTNPTVAYVKRGDISFGNVLIKIKYTFLRLQVNFVKTSVIHNQGP